MLEKIFDKILEDKEETEEIKKGRIEKKRTDRQDWFWPLVIFLLALLPRLYFLFFIANPHNPGARWYGDTFHRWQIAYLTREIGWSQGHRLWDLKGMEYFWGVLHPFLMNVLFSLTGRVDIWLGRILTSVAGSGIAVLLYLLGKRYWNEKLGLAMGIFTALFSIGLFNDTSGSVEPIGLVLLLWGIWFWPQKPFFTGFLWALAAMSRAEAWLFSLGLLGFLFLFSGYFEKFVITFLSWLLPMLAYIKYLGVQTGNYIYPIYWNFLANARGAWSDRPIPDAEERAVQPYFITFFILSLLGITWVVGRKRKAKQALLLILFFGNSAFIMGMMGLTTYLLSYESWFWMIRFFVFPYLLLAFLIAIFLFTYLPSVLKLKKIWMPGFILWFVLLGLTQLAWRPIMAKYNRSERAYQLVREIGEEVGKEKGEGKILVPEEDPGLIYTMVRFGGIRGREMVSQMFDPFFYMEEDPFADWPKTREVLFDWFKKENIKWALFPTGRVERYNQVLRREAPFFELIRKLPAEDNNVYELYQIKI